mgnify:CR=1 FL=1
MYKSIRKNSFAYLAISPFFIQFFVFQLVPTISTFFLSLTNWNGMGKIGKLSVNNYIRMVTDSQFIDSLKNTIVYWLIGIIGVLTFALMIASLLNNELLRFKSFFKTATFLPYVCASLAMGLIFGMLFDENAGLINEVIKYMGGNPQPWLTSSRLSRFPVHVLFIWRTIPWYVSIIYSGLLNIPFELYEAATVDGASGLQKFTKITLPLLGNILFFCFVTLTVDTWKIFNEPYTLKGPGYSNTSIFQLMYENAFKIFKMGYASALGVILIIILTTISLIQFNVRRRQGEI